MEKTKENIGLSVIQMAKKLGIETDYTQGGKIFDLAKANGYVYKDLAFFKSVAALDKAS